MTRFEHKTFRAGWTRLILAAITTLLAAAANAAVTGNGGTSFNLTATDGQISVSDGGSIYMWGYSAPDGTTMQLPGPTLIVNQGDPVTVTLNNNLPSAAGNTSIVFPGHDVTATGGVAGDLTQEAAPGGSVTYTFTAGAPGTYQYHSGTQPDLQVEMGLYGAIIVRPTTIATPDGMAGCAYNHTGSCYDREYLYILSEIDLDIHEAAAMQANGDGPIVLPVGAYHSEYWLLNGRAAPDTMAPDFDASLPTQPYGSLSTMYPGQKVLVRLVGAGREMHPFHTHGNHLRKIAQDGRMIVNGAGNLAGPTIFTVPTLPGGTVDGIFEWTGKGLGWDMYGHAPGDPLEDFEWAEDHGKPLPVDLPAISSLAFGGFYSGSPFLGALGALPPGEGGLNPNAGFAYMWHSHTERELTNNDIYPGGMLTMMIIEARPATTP